MNSLSKWIAAACVGGSLVAGACFAAEPQGKLPEAEMVKALGSWLDERVKADEFSGVVLVAKDGKPIFRQAYGFADLGLQVPNRVDTKFNLGSINKMFTRLSIEQLAEQGKLSLDDTVGKHLPDYPNADVREKVTIRQLIDHRSGMGDIFTEKFRGMAKERIRTVADALTLFVDDPLLFAPGMDQKYSNAGYVVLGAIVEKVSGENYYEYVREHIYKPAGMKDTDSYELDVPVPNRAVGYTRNSPNGPAPGGGRRNNLFATFFKGTPAGGGYSTVDDLLAFDGALRSGKLFKTPRRIAGIGIAGGTGGANAILEQVDEHYTVIALSNYDPPAAMEVGKKVRGWMGIVDEEEDGRVMRRRP